MSEFTKQIIKRNELEIAWYQVEIIKLENQIEIARKEQRELIKQNRELKERI